MKANMYKSLPTDNMKRHKSGFRPLAFAIAMFFMLIPVVGVLFSTKNALAYLDGFDAGNIINDYTMSNHNSMSEADIQRWLTAINPCNDRNYSEYLYLMDYYKDKPRETHSWHWEDGHFVCISEEKFGDGTVLGQGDTAAHIIWQAAQDFRINPQVLIVMLEKEQGLITSDGPWFGAYHYAMGFACYDHAPSCVAKYAGFKNQVRSAANLLREVLDGGWTNYPLGVNYIQYSPDVNCGSSPVYIVNRATSALYRYTPYQPNAAALAAGWGDVYCGAYGNRNFYNHFTNWFGSTQTHAPIDENISIDTITSDLPFKFTSHVAYLGWQRERDGGNAVGTVGQQVQMEAFRINLPSTAEGDILYRAHVEGIGWMDWSRNGNTAGTTGLSRRIEAIQIQLVGKLAEKYDIYYRAHVKDTGWMGWVKNGESAGTAGESLRLEALQVVILEKNSNKAPEIDGSGFRKTEVSATVTPYFGPVYRTHVQDYGWISYWSLNGKQSGTTGQSKRLEAIEISTSGDEPKSLEYRVHVQNIGWMDWVKNGEMAGTAGQSLRLEALEIRLNEEDAAKYNVKYRVHVQDYGWMDWRDTGELAGTTGQSKRLEAVEVKIEKK